MIRMTFKQYDEEMERFAKMPETSKKHGITEQELQKMEKQPEHYYRYAMYLLAHDPYKDGGNNDAAFTNTDAALPTDVAFRLDTLVDSVMELFDTQEELNAAIKAEKASAKIA